jgi:oxygen-independent coproporphyrinogen-3 oxidase
MPGSVSSLYVHVPFCAQKCSYCAFFSEASSGELINRYVDALVKDLEALPAERGLETVFFGGGTPSILNLRQWERIIPAITRLGVSATTEWTVECNPATVSLDKATLLRNGGVNRISMGVQSLEPELLDRLGRVHSREMVFKSFDILRTAGFDNLNLDLMFAIPGQTMQQWKSTLETAVAFGSEHLSCYEIIYEEDTPIFQQLKEGKVSLDEDLACEMYEVLIERAAQGGFAQYEVANFARTGRACRHNLNYWRGRSYYGIGPSAAGYVDGVRTKNISNTQIYCERIERGESPVEETEKLEPLARAGETAAFGLRMAEGVNFQDFNRLTGRSLPTEWKDEIACLVKDGWARVDGESVALTPLGLRFADAAAEKFLR